MLQYNYILNHKFLNINMYKGSSGTAKSFNNNILTFANIYIVNT